MHTIQATIVGRLSLPPPHGPLHERNVSPKQKNVQLKKRDKTPLTHTRYKRLQLPPLLRTATTAPLRDRQHTRLLSPHPPIAMMLKAIVCTIPLVGALVSAATTCGIADGAPFKLVAYNASTPTSSPYKPTAFLQAYMASPSDTLALYSFAGGVPFDYGDNFTYDRAAKRLVTTVTNQTGTYTYKSAAPIVNRELTFYPKLSGTSGQLVEATHGPCNSPGQSVFFVLGSSTDSDYYHPWLLCQKPGFTTGIKSVLDGRGVTTLPPGCSRVALKPYPA